MNDIHLNDKEFQYLRSQFQRLRHLTERHGGHDLLTRKGFDHIMDHIQLPVDRGKIKILLTANKLYKASDQ